MFTVRYAFVLNVNVNYRCKGVGKTNTLHCGTKIIDLLTCDFILVICSYKLNSQYKKDTEAGRCVFSVETDRAQLQNIQA